VVLFVCVNVVNTPDQWVFVAVAALLTALASWRLHLLWKTRWLRRAEREDNEQLQRLDALVSRISA
jgi:hypothetical protein